MRKSAKRFVSLAVRSRHRRTGQADDAQNGKDVRKKEIPPLLLFFLFVVPVLKDSPSPSALDFLFSPLLSFRPRSCLLRFALSFSPAHFACHGPRSPVVSLRGRIIVCRQISSPSFSVDSLVCFSFI